MAISLELIKQLRDSTGVSMTSCKKALEESNGDLQKAIEYLRKKGEAKASERSIRSTGEGTIASYIHQNNKVGVLVQLGCETDFVAKNEDFKQLARDIALHIAGLSPVSLLPEEVPEELIAKEREIWREQLINEGKKEDIIENIMQGKEKKFREESSLLKQSFIKNPEVTIEQLLTESINKMGENIKIVKFVRYSI